MYDVEVPVLIVGGGGAGLTSSMLLARQGVDHLLISARPGTSDLPKAHVLNQRAMEILEDVGVADAIAQRSTPAHRMAATAFYAGFAGPEGDYGRQLAKLECWGAGGARRELARRERVASAQPSADPPRAAAQGPRRGAVSRQNPLQPRAAGTGAGRRRRNRPRARPRRRARVLRALPVSAGRRRRAPRRPGGGRDLRGTWCRHGDRHPARGRRLLRLGRGPGRPDPLDLLATDGGHGSDGPDGARALGAGLRGVGHPHQLSGQRPARAVGREGRSGRARGDRPARRPDGRPQDHPVVGRRGDGVGVQCRAGVPARRCRAPAPPDGRTRADKCHP